MWYNKVTQLMIVVLVKCCKKWTTVSWYAVIFYNSRLSLVVGRVCFMVMVLSGVSLL